MIDVLVMSPAGAGSKSATGLMEFMDPDSALDSFVLVNHQTVFSQSKQWFPIQRMKQHFLPSVLLHCTVATLCALPITPLIIPHPPITPLLLPPAAGQAYTFKMAFSSNLSLDGGENWNTQHYNY